MVREDHHGSLGHGGEMFAPEQPRARLQNPVGQQVVDVSRERIRRVVAPVHAIRGEPSDKGLHRPRAGGVDVASERVADLVERPWVPAAEKGRDGGNEGFAIEWFSHY